jgi:beta-ureidopropionase
LKQAAIEKHPRYIKKVAEDNAKVVCLQELFCGPYFCAEQDRRSYRTAELVTDGSVTTLMQEIARKHEIVLIVPMYEEDGAGIYYNSAPVVDAEGKYLGKYRKTHIPHCRLAFWEKCYSKPGNLGYLFSEQLTQKRESTSAMTVISPKAPGRWV